MFWFKARRSTSQPTYSPVGPFENANEATERRAMHVEHGDDVGNVEQGDINWPKRLPTVVGRVAKNEQDGWLLSDGTWVPIES